MKARHREGVDEPIESASASVSVSGSAEEVVGGPRLIEPELIADDRGIPSVNRARSLQSRVSNALAMGLMAALGVGLISWYYVHMFARQSKARENVKSSTAAKMQGEMVLPALGRIDPPRVAPLVEQVLGPAPELPEAWPESPERVGPPGRTAGASGAYSSSVGAAKSMQELARDRRLGGPAFVAAALRGEPSARQTEFELPGAASMPAQGDERSARSAGDLTDFLEPTVTPAVLASVLPTQRMLLAKGSFVDCTLETALDSTLPGMATCVTATDTFGVDGKVVLLERGTKLVGETRGSVRQGAARIFVLWTQARTPDGVIVPLTSPGTDELGRSGLPGEVDRHFFERFGAAMLISLIDAVVQSAVQSSLQPSADGSTVIYNPSTSQDILTEVLRSTVNIPPTVRKRQGDRIQVLVARDLDFRSVYRLRAAIAGESR